MRARPKHGTAGAAPARSTDTPPREAGSRTARLPASALQPRGRARVGQWLWTTRPFAERDLCEELVLWRPESRPQVVAPSLVASDTAPLHEDGRPQLTFARQGFVVAALVAEHDPRALAAALESALQPRLDAERAAALQVWVPDADASNPLAASAAALRQALCVRMPHADASVHAHMPQDTQLVQVCLASAELAYAGVLPLGHALSHAPGGRERMRVPGDRPSRSARKLEEALAWIGVAPGPGERCLDLGAAPGGWTWVARRRGCKVTAVDPARLRPDVAADRGVRHVQASAFGFAPDEPVDWLLCDMAWRPLEVAAMLARYARRGETRFLIANFKLPMKRKAELLLRVRDVLHAGGYRDLRCRQLYHDRDEVTVFARV